MSRVNIIIPVHNRPEHTEQTIVSLYQNTAIDSFFLTVIDDGSDQKTRELLRGLYKEYDFDFTSYSRAFGPAFARNNACRSLTLAGLRKDYLYHSDNDVYFTKGWLETLLETFRAVQPDFKVLGGSCHPYLQNKNLITLNPAIRGVGQKDAVSGYSQLMTWETWDQFGPFDENQGSQEKKIMGSEDWAFCQRIIKAGFLVGSIEPEVVIPCGKTNTYGEPATGAETFKEVEGAKII